MHSLTIQAIDDTGANLTGAAADITCRYQQRAGDTLVAIADTNPDELAAGVYQFGLTEDEAEGLVFVPEVTGSSVAPAGSTATVIGLSPTPTKVGELQAPAAKPTGPGWVMERTGHKVLLEYSDPGVADSSAESNRTFCVVTEEQLGFEFPTIGGVKALRALYRSTYHVPVADGGGIYLGWLVPDVEGQWTNADGQITVRYVPHADVVTAGEVPTSWPGDRTATGRVIFTTANSSDEPEAPIVARVNGTTYMAFHSDDFNGTASFQQSMCFELNNPAVAVENTNVVFGVPGGVDERKFFQGDWHTGYTHDVYAEIPGRLGNRFFSELLGGGGTTSGLALIDPRGFFGNFEWDVIRFGRVGYGAPVVGLDSDVRLSPVPRGAGIAKSGVYASLMNLSPSIAGGANAQGELYSVLYDTEDWRMIAAPRQVTSGGLLAGFDDSLRTVTALIPVDDFYIGIGVGTDADAPDNHDHIVAYKLRLVDQMQYEPLWPAAPGPQLLRNLEADPIPSVGDQFVNNVANAGSAITVEPEGLGMRVAGTNGRAAVAWEKGRRIPAQHRGLYFEADGLFTKDTPAASDNNKAASQNPLVALGWRAAGAPMNDMWSGSNKIVDGFMFLFAATETKVQYFEAGQATDETVLTTDYVWREDGAIPKRIDHPDRPGEPYLRGMARSVGIYWDIERNRMFFAGDGTPAVGWFDLNLPETMDFNREWEPYLYLVANASQEAQFVARDFKVVEHNVAYSENRFDQQREGPVARIASEISRTTAQSVVAKLDNVPTQAQAAADKAEITAAIGPKLYETTVAPAPASTDTAINVVADPPATLVGKTITIAGTQRTVTAVTAEAGTTPGIITVGEALADTPAGGDAVFVDRAVDVAGSVDLGTVGGEDVTKSDLTSGGAGGQPVRPRVINAARTWHYDPHRSSKRPVDLVEVGVGFDGELAIEPPINPGSGVAAITGVTIGGSATGLSEFGPSADAEQGVFTIAPGTLLTAGKFEVVATVTTTDGQTLPLAATLRVS